MLDLAINTAYYQALYTGLDVPVYQPFAIPETVNYPYVIISSIDIREDISQSCKLWRVDVTLDVVTGSPSPTGMNQAYEIGGEIEDIINPPSRESIPVEGYVIGSTRLIGSTPLQLRTKDWWIYRNIRVYSHVVWASNES